MATLIRGPVLDSAGRPANGRLEWRQSVAFNSGGQGITQSLAIANVVEGQIFALDGGPFTMPPNPGDTFVVVLESLRGRAAQRQVSIPDQAEASYADLLPPVLGQGAIWYVDRVDSPRPSSMKPGDWLFIHETNYLMLIGA